MQKIKLSSSGVSLLDAMPGSNKNLCTADMDISGESCCGGSSSYCASSPYEIPGYEILPFVDSFITHNSKLFPVVKNDLSFEDRKGSFLTRWGYKRDSYKVAPGLYASGSPDENSEVFVSANYKISFDHLRLSLKGINAWILVIDTMGVNVWCAAGKKTFSTGEIIARIDKSGLDKVVNHRRIIVPQLGAPGVSSIEVKKGSGFSVVWGPVYTKDIPEFVENGLKANEDMREVKFPIKDRAVLIPVEVYLSIKPIIIGAIILFLISGFGPGIFSFKEMLDRGSIITLFYITGMFAGIVLTPLLLPYLPTKLFFIKGIAAGLLISIIPSFYFINEIGISGVIAGVLCNICAASYTGMNFTGSTPYTSPSGVEKEMKAAIPIQILISVAAFLLWIYSAFKGVI